MKMRKLLILLLCLTLVLPSTMLFGANDRAQASSTKVLIYIPGITGTELRNPDDPDDYYWPSVNDLDELDYSNDLDTGGLLGWSTSEYKRGVFNVYGDAEEYFEDEGYEVLPFPYDWRDDNADTADELADFIQDVKDEYNVSKVDIVAHSMGGLVAKRYILDHKNSHSVRRFVSIGTPYFGSPESFLNLQSGMRKLGIKAVDEDIIRTIPAVYQLLPNKSFFNVYNTAYVGTEDIDGDRDAWTYGETKDYIEDNFDDDLFADAEDFQDVMNDSVGKYVNFYRIIGDQESTVGFILDEEYWQYRRYGAPRIANRWTTISVNGDGTVPLTGAAPGSNRTWFVEEDHVGLAENNDVLEAVDQILSGDEDDVDLRDEYELTKKLKLTVYNAKKDEFTLTAASADEEPRIKPSITLTYPDGAQFVMQYGEIVSDPKNLNVIDLGSSIEFAVDPGDYQLQIANDDPNVYTGLLVSKIENDVNTQRVDFQSMDLGADGQVLASLSSDFSRHQVGVDTDGNGQADEQVEAREQRTVNSPLVPVPTGDEPPIPVDPDEDDPQDPGDGGGTPGSGSVTIDISGTEGRNGWLTSPATIQVATDITIPAEDPPAEDAPPAGVTDDDGEAEEPPVALEPELTLSIDGEAEVPVAGSYTLATDGKHTVTAFAKDAEGTVLGQASEEFKIDQTVPSLRTRVAGVRGDNGWLISDAQVSVGASDETSKLYRVDSKIDSAALSDYEGPTTITAEGMHRVYAEAEDNASNRTTKEESFKIDKTKPVISDVYLQDEYYWDQEFPISFQVCDDVSQVETVRATINEVPVQNGGTYRFAQPGWHTYRIEVKDYAGWKAVFEEKFEVYIPANFTFAPNSLQLDHGNGTATSFIELPEPFEPTQIQISTVQLNDKIVHVQDPTYGYVNNPIGDEDEDGIPDMKLKYERGALVQTIEPRNVQDKWGQATLTIFGEWQVYHFKGYDDIQIVNSGYQATPDVTPPTAVSVPTEGAQGVSVGSTPYLTFSERISLYPYGPISDASAQELFTFTDRAGNNIGFTANYMKNSQAIQLNPIEQLQGEQTYTVTLKPNTVADALYNQNAEYAFSFQTETHAIVFEPPLPMPVLEQETDSPVNPPAPTPAPGEDETPTPAPSHAPATSTQLQVPGGIAEQDLDARIEIASREGSAVVLNADSGQQRVALTLKQLQKLSEKKLQLIVEASGVTYRLQPDVLQVDGHQQASHISLGAQRLTADASQTYINGAGNREQYHVLGDVFHLQSSALLANQTEQALTHFNGKILVALPVPEQARQARLVVSRFNEQTNRWDEVPGLYDKDTGTYQFETDKFSYWALMEKKAKPFSDITEHWARQDIEFMSAQGYVNGLSEDVFAPEQNVTRAQFATLLANVVELQEDAPALPFTDVASGDWYAPFVKRAYAAGLIQGVSADQFAPNQAITREEMAVMIDKALLLTGKSPAVDEQSRSAESFTDIAQVSPWAQAAVLHVADAGIAQGKPHEAGMQYAPQDVATRAEAVVMLKRFFDQL